MSTRILTMGLYDKFNALLEQACPNVGGRRTELDMGKTNWSSQLAYMKQRVQQDIAKGWHSTLRLGLYDDAGNPMDKAVATGALDNQIHALRDVLQDFPAGQCSLSIGREVNGWWNKYTPFVMPLAHRRIMNIIDSDHVPAGFCYEPSATFDVFEGPFVNGCGKWWPGKQYVQQLEGDAYNTDCFTGPLSQQHGTQPPKLTRAGRLDEFANAAALLGLPLDVTEAALVNLSVTANPAEFREALSAYFAWLAKKHVRRAVWNNVRYDTPQFQKTDWAKGWKNTCVNDEPSVLAHFQARAEEWTVGTSVEPQAEDAFAESRG